MANYSRKDAEDQGNAEVGLGATLLTSLATLLLGSLAKSSSEKEKKSESK